MKTHKLLKTAHVTMKITTPLKRRIEEMAKKERRSFADQAAYLIEKGLLVMERQENKVPRKLYDGQGIQDCTAST